MRTILQKTIVFGLALGLIAILSNPVNAQHRDGDGGRGGGDGFKGGERQGMDMMRSGEGRGSNIISEGTKNITRGTNNFYQQGSNAIDRGANVNINRNRADFDRNRSNYSNMDRDRGKWTRWDRNYSSFYGRDWDYRPGFGWGVNIPLGRFGGIGIGDYGYYGRGWNYWGPDGYYGSWGPGYDTYGYDYSSPTYYTQSDQQNIQNNQSEQQENELPPVPSSKELAKFTNQQLQSFIAWVADGFGKELGQYGTGNTWVKYFRLNDLKALAPNAPSSSNSDMASSTDIASKHSQNVIDEVLDRIKSASKNDEYKTITDSWGFKALEVALREASKPQSERRPDVLKGQVEILNKSLDHISTGDDWRKHLEINTIEKLADKKGKDLESSDDVAGIAKTFDKVAQNSEYQAIVQLPGFAGVHSTLRQLTEGEKSNSSTAKKESSSEDKSSRE